MANGLIVLPVSTELLATLSLEFPMFASSLPPWSAWRKTFEHMKGARFRVDGADDELQVDIELSDVGATSLDVSLDGDRIISAWFRREHDLNLALLRAVAADNGALAHVAPSSGEVELVVPEPALRTHWPFAPRPTNEAATCTESVLDRRAPIRFAANLDEDGGWYFSDGTPFDPTRSRLVSLETCLNLDPSIGRLAALRPGTEASRRSSEEEWERTG